MVKIFEHTNLKRQGGKFQRRRKKRNSKFRRKKLPLINKIAPIPKLVRNHQLFSNKKTKTLPKLTKTLPSIFSFKENRENVLEFLNDTFDDYKQYKVKDFIFDMQDITAIDITSICLFLSLLNKLSANGVDSRGNYPIDESSRNVMIESGFANIMKSSIKRLKTKTYDNQLYVIGQDRLDNKKIGESVKKAVGYLTGKEDHFQPIYTMLIEICSNSVEHANKREKDKNWIISVSYEEDKVNFIVVDTGEGILRTIHKKLPELFVDTFFRKDGKVLEDVLNKEYQSRTKELNRHKGLPKLKENFDNGYVSDMKILTNNVLYDMKTKSYEGTINEYCGVLYSWSFTKNNYNKWKRNECI